MLLFHTNALTAVDHGDDDGDGGWCIYNNDDGFDIFIGFGRLTPQLSVASYSNNEEGQVIIFYFPVFCLLRAWNIPELVPIWGPVQFFSRKYYPRSVFLLCKKSLRASIIISGNMFPWRATHYKSCGSTPSAVRFDSEKVYNMDTYWSLLPLPPVVNFFQAGVIFSIENAKLWPILANLGYFVVN